MVLVDKRTKFCLGELFSYRKESGVAGLPVLSVTMNDGLVHRDTLERKTDGKLTPKEHLLIRKGDIAYNMMRMWQGASGLARQDGIVSPAYVVVTPSDAIDPTFASYWFKSARMIHLFWAYSYGITGDRLRLYYRDFAKIPVTVPPKNDQIRIGKTLAATDRAIARTEDLIAAKRRLKEGVAEQLLTGRCRMPNFKEEWQVVRSDEICEIVIGKTPARKSTSYWTTEGIGHPWATIRDLRSRWITDTSEKITDLGIERSNAKLIARGTTLMSFKLTIGKTARAGIDLYTNEAIAAFFAKDRKVSQEYLCLALPVAVAAAVTDQAIKGATLNKAKVEGMLIRLPPLSEQLEISALIEAAERSIELLEKKQEALLRLKKGLMHKLLLGELRVEAG